MTSNINVNSDLFREIENLYLNEGLSRAAIVARYRGRTKSTTVHRYVAVVLSRAAENKTPLQPRRESGGGAAFHNQVLSDVHHNVGLHILQHRLGGGENKTPRDYAKEFGIGNQLTICRMEHGKYEFTLSELIHIASTIGLSVSELISPNWKSKESAA
jgi:hypothetical protein